MGIVDALITPGGGIATLLDDVIKRVWKDPIEADKVSDNFKLQLMQMQQQGQLATLDASLKTQLAQLQIVDDEAKNPNLLVSGAHAACEWVVAAGLAYQLIIRPLTAWASIAFWHVAPPPALDGNTLLTMFSMLFGSAAVRVVNGRLQQ